MTDGGILRVVLRVSRTIGINVVREEAVHFVFKIDRVPWAQASKVEHPPPVIPGLRQIRKRWARNFFTIGKRSRNEEFTTAEHGSTNLVLHSYFLLIFVNMCLFHGEAKVIGSRHLVNHLLAKANELIIPKRFITNLLVTLY